MSFFDLTRTPGVHCRLLRGGRVYRSGDGRSWAIRHPEGAVIRFLPQEVEYAAVLESLSRGAHAAELRDLALEDGGPSRATAFMLVLGRLGAAGLIEFPLLDEGGERAVLLPLWPAFVPSLAAEPSAEAALDRFACIRRDGRGWLLESPLVGAQLSFTELAALDAAVVRRALAAAGFFEQREADPGRREALEQWEFHDLVSYRRHRRGWRRDPLGAVYYHLETMDPPPATRPPWPGEQTPLPSAAAGRPGEPARESSDGSLAAVLERRASVRAYDPDHPITLGEIGALFDRAARIRERPATWLRPGAEATGYQVEKRPYPTGGASGELELYLAVDCAADIEPGLYHYDAAGHALVRISDRTPAVDALLAEARGASGAAATQALVIVTARFARVMWKYRSIAYALVLRDTGVLYQTLYLAATDLGLAPCALGAGDSTLFAEATGLDPLIEGSVGEFLLGGRPAAQTGANQTVATGTAPVQAAAAAEAGPGGAPC